MKRRNPRAIIFRLPTYADNAPATKPRILPFSGQEPNRQSAEAAPSNHSAAELGEVRERLFRMIVANQWDRSHGNRAS